jgi:hypothetical protein
MKINHTSHLEKTNAKAMRAQLIAPGLVLALLLSPFSYAAAQQSQTHGSQAHDSQGSGVTPQTQSAKPAQPARAPGDDNAPVPPMPPLDPAEAASTPTSSDLLPDSPGTLESAQLENQAPVTQQSEAQPQNPQPVAQQPPPPMPKEPLGTAAAQTVPTMGIAASRPAGAALAPAKQHRIRTILIRTGAVVGAAAVVGVTMALTEASPSKPPGAH